MCERARALALPYGRAASLLKGCARPEPDRHARPSTRIWPNPIVISALTLNKVTVALDKLVVDGQGRAVRGINTTPGGAVGGGTAKCQEKQPPGRPGTSLTQRNEYRGTLARQRCNRRI